MAPQDTDPDNEVGIVGNTLNRLLDNVDSALAHRADSDLRMRQFITDASHELRTPLAAIHGYAELTRQDSSALPPTTEYALARIESEARRMTSLVDELLLLSRLGEGEDLQTEDVDLADLVINAVNDAAVAAPTHQWIKDLPDEPVWVRGDHARLHQLVSNLLNNARVHTPPGVTVTTGIARHRSGPDAPYAELTVDDDGPDIDAESCPGSSNGSSARTNPEATGQATDWAWRSSVRSSRPITVRSAPSPATAEQSFGCGSR